MAAPELFERLPWTRDPDGTWRRLLPGEDVDLEALDDDEGDPDVAVVPTSILPFPWETFPRQFLGPIEGPENPRTAPSSPFELAFVVGDAEARPPAGTPPPIDFYALDDEPPAVGPVPSMADAKEACENAVKKVEGQVRLPTNVGADLWDQLLKVLLDIREKAPTAEERAPKTEEEWKEIVKG